MRGVFCYELIESELVKIFRRAISQDSGQEKTPKMLLLHANTTELKKIKNKNMMKVFLEAQKVVLFRSTSRL